MNVYQAKKEKKSIPVVMKMCFSEGKLIIQFGNPPSKRTPPPNFFMTSLFVQILKTRNSP